MTTSSTSLRGVVDNFVVPVGQLGLQHNYNHRHLLRDTKYMTQTNQTATDNMRNIVPTNTSTLPIGFNQASCMKGLFYVIVSDNILETS